MKKYLLLVIITLTSFDFILLYKLYVKEEIVVNEFNNSNQIEQMCDSIFFDYVELVGQDVQLNNIVEYVSHVNNLSTSLIYVFTDEECSKCVLDDIFLIKEYVDDNNIDNVFIFPVFDDTKTNNIRLKSILDGLNYKRINKENVQLYKKNGFNERFFTIVKPTGQVVYHFFPGEMYSVKTKKYLEYIFNECLKEGSIPKSIL
ncbi:MAG: hypothetical protein JXR50_02920 [Prolixibacteraceae bacterium]|nr:hypothetical protein [Prolixibacteraceae bacterium]